MTPILKPLAEQVVLITGASSGIGLVTARMAAARGAAVMLVARDGDALIEIVKGIEGDGGRAAFAIADVGELREVQAAAAEAVERFGRIDTWVSNAGVAIYAKLIDTPMEQHEALFRTNYFGVVHSALTAVEHLQRKGGALITVASIAADMPSPIMGAYSASKHAVKAYIESLRIEIKADMLPIAVTLIKPAGIDTPIAQHAANHLAGEALIPPPVYDPTLVAEAILDAAEHVRRDVTVGGVGRAQVLVTQHFPQLLDWFGGLLKPVLHDAKKPKTASDNLAVPMRDGDERSELQQGRTWSAYAHRNTIAGAAAVGGLAFGISALLLKRRGGD